MNWLRWSLGMLLWVLALAVLLAELPSAIAIALFVIGAALVLSTKYGGLGAGLD